MKAVGKKVIVKKDTEEETTDSGIVVPEKAQDRQRTGEVLAVGPRVTEPVEVGQTVLFDEYSFLSAEIEGQDCLIIEQKNLLGVVKNA
jgi:chaperonin GroES